MNDKLQQKAARPEEKPESKKPRFVTFGQRFQAWSTYISVDWILNYITGLSFAMWGEYSKTGQRIWAKPLAATARFFSEKVFRLSGPNLELGIKNVVRFTSVIAGGMFTIPPLMYLENKSVRKSMIQWYDRAWYGKEKVDNDPKFTEAYAAMDTVHKQGFWTGLISRLGALAPLLASVWMPSLRNLTKSQEYLDWVGKHSANAFNAVGLTKERLFRGHAMEEQKDRWKFLHSNSAMDFGLEPFYAVLHMVFYRSLADFVGKAEDKHDQHKAHKKAVKMHIKLNHEYSDTPQKEESSNQPTTQVAHISRESQLASGPQMGQIGTN